MAVMQFTRSIFLVLAVGALASGCATGHTSTYQKPPSYVAHNGDGWQVDCPGGFDVFGIDILDLSPFQRADGSWKTRAEFCEESNIRSRIRRPVTDGAQQK